MVTLEWGAVGHGIIPRVYSGSNNALIKSGGGTGPLKPRQPAPDAQGANA
jgi:hypothetical protein